MGSARGGKRHRALIISCARWTFAREQPTTANLSAAPRSPCPAPPPVKFDGWKAAPTSPQPLPTPTTPSAGLSFGFAAGAPPPSTGLACGLFMTPRMTSQGGVAPPSAVKPRALVSKRPNLAAAAAARKKNKVADDSSRRSKKKLAGRPAAPPPTEAPESSQFVVPATDAAPMPTEAPESSQFVVPATDAAPPPTEAQESSQFVVPATDAAPPPTEAPESLQFVAPAANAHKVCDEMLTSFSYDTYMSTMGVGSNNDAVGDLANTIQTPDDNGALENGEEEEESSSEESKEEEEEDDVA
nr:pistil-specific extensin-like protein [Aegilops tauschii subsp. strangulata]